MRHSGKFARAVPVFDIRRNPHHVAFLYGLHGFAPFLETPDAFGNDEILPLGVAVPVGEHIRRKVDDGGGNIAVGRHNGQSGVTALAGEMGGVGGLHGLDGLGGNLGHGLGLDKGAARAKQSAVVFWKIFSLGRPLLRCRLKADSDGVLRFESGLAGSIYPSLCVSASLPNARQLRRCSNPASGSGCCL